MSEPNSTRRRRIAVVGGGISGLAAAHRIVELRPDVDVCLFEASDRLGGILQTERHDGFLIERGADSFITSLPWAVNLCQRIGFAKELVPTASVGRTAYVVHRGRLRPVPRGFQLMSPTRLWPLMTSRVLSVRGKARLLREMFVAKRTDGAEESLAQFARRRFGDEVFERLVQPLVGGIYSADPERLSLAATLPRFIDQEQRHGSLIRAARKGPSASHDADASGARYSQFVTPREGLGSLAKALTDRLPSGAVRLGQAVRAIEPNDSAGWRLLMDGHEPLTVDAVVLAASTPVIGRLLAPVDASLAEQLNGIEHAGTAIVSLGYAIAQLTRPLPGFGFVVPTVERRQILAASFSSNKFPHRAPEGHALVRAFLGGALQAELLSLSDDELIAIARRELQELVGAQGEPVLCRVARWSNVMPQYHLGHEARIAEIESRMRQLPGLAIASNALHGVGIPQCIRSGENAAENVLSSLVR